MARLAPGTQTPDALAYTQEQRDTLETMKDRAYALGIARAEFANHLLHPDGTVSDDPELMLTAARELVRNFAAAGSSKDLRMAAALAQKVEEIEEHITQGRFLFVLDADALPVIYFQAAVSHNPDLPALAADAPAEG
jgi:hypothetical protein